MQLKPRYPFYLASKPVDSGRDLAVTDKYTGEVVTRVALADASDIDRAIAAAVAAAPATAALPAYERQAILNHCVQRFQQRFEELAYSLCIEAGKPIKDARGEVTRLIDTFRIAAEESVRLHGALQTLEISPRGCHSAPARLFRRLMSRSLSPPIRWHPRWPWAVPS